VRAGFGPVLTAGIEPAASRLLDTVAAGGSVASFVDTAGEFAGKDIPVARSIAAELGSNLGVLGDVIDTAIQV
jgi:hypothetical protein